jgi:hypothetical protein
MGRAFLFCGFRLATMLPRDLNRSSGPPCPVLDLASSYHSSMGTKIEVNSAYKEALRRWRRE